MRGEETWPGPAALLHSCVLQRVFLPPVALPYSCNLTSRGGGKFGGQILSKRVGGYGVSERNCPSVSLLNQGREVMQSCHRRASTCHQSPCCCLVLCCCQAGAHLASKSSRVLPPSSKPAVVQGPCHGDQTARAYAGPCLWCCSSLCLFGTSQPTVLVVALRQNDQDVFQLFQSQPAPPFQLSHLSGVWRGISELPSLRTPFAHRWVTNGTCPCAGPSAGSSGGDTGVCLSCCLCTSACGPTMLGWVWAGLLLCRKMLCSDPWSTAASITGSVVCPQGTWLCVV